MDAPHEIRRDYDGRGPASIHQGLYTEYEGRERKRTGSELGMGPESRVSQRPEECPVQSGSGVSLWLGSGLNPNKGQAQFMYRSLVLMVLPHCQALGGGYGLLPCPQASSR